MIHFFHLPLKCYNATISMYAALADLLFSLNVCPNALPLPASTPLLCSSIIILPCTLDVGLTVVC